MRNYCDKKERFYSSSQKTMAEILKAMDTLVRGLNDEDAYYDHWIWLVPDEATDEDFMDIAEDNEDINEVVEQFLLIMNHYCILQDMDEE